MAQFSFHEAFQIEKSSKSVCDIDLEIHKTTITQGVLRCRQGTPVSSLDNGLSLLNFSICGASSLI